MKSSNRTVVRVLLGILAAAVVFVVGFGSGATTMWFVAKDGGTPSNPVQLLGTSADETEISDQGQMLWDIYGILKDEYIDPEAVDADRMIYGAASGMVSTLGDAHTTFVEPAAASVMDEDMQGSFEGIGATVDMVDGVVVIVRPLPGSPAEKAGIKAGDHVLAVNGESIEGLTLYEAITRIRGPRGTVATLLIEREGVDGQLTIEVTRDEIELETVEYRMLDNNIGYVRLAEFNAVSGDKVAEALKELMSQDAVGIVFDLRDNPGGYLHMAVDVAGQFLPRGTLILTEAQRDEDDQEYRSDGKGPAVDVPLAVLINGGSASASEIVAGAIQEQGRGVLVGETSYGKGSVQQTHTLQDGSSLRVTIARWLLPSGRNLDGDGLVPDVEVELTQEDYDADLDPQLDAAVEFLLDETE